MQRQGSDTYTYVAVKQQGLLILCLLYSEHIWV